MRTNMAAERNGVRTQFFSQGPGYFEILVLRVITYFEKINCLGNIDHSARVTGHIRELLKQTRFFTVYH